MSERVQKFLSSAGASSRRKAEEFIRSKQVTINGRVAKLGDKVDPEKDTVKVYGKVIKPRPEPIYLMLNKPTGVVTSKRDPRGRKTVFGLLPEDLRAKVWNVGRLDYDTEGLLLLTNDGELTQELSHPRFEHEKEYEVTTAEEPTEAQLSELRGGVELVTGFTHPAKVKLKGGRVFVTIHEGKKRQVRRMFAAVGLTVSHLRRVRIGKLTLPKDLAAGAFRQIQRSDIM